MTTAMQRYDAALATARNLMNAHGLRDWSLRLNNAKRAAGSCNYQTRTITLSKFFLAQRSDEENLDTITHEIAHALTKGHRHDLVWQLKHRELGGNRAPVL
jgi:predicted metal-dependent hydrolase